MSRSSLETGSKRFRAALRKEGPRLVTVVLGHFCPFKDFWIITDTGCVCVCALFSGCCNETIGSQAKHTGGIVWNSTLLNPLPGMNGEAPKPSSRSSSDSRAKLCGAVKSNSVLIRQRARLDETTKTKGDMK